MADPNGPPRRVSMAYILGFSNKPFKDPPPPRPPQPSALAQMVSTPGGIVEWAASDGRKGKLTGTGRQRLTAASLAKVPSERRSAKDALDVKVEEKKAATENAASMIGGLFGGLDLDGAAAGGDAKKDGNDSANTWTAEDDKKMMDWRNENPNAPWLSFAEEIKKSVAECKDHFRQIKPADWKPNAAKAKGGGGNQKSGKKDKNQNQNQNQGKNKTGEKKNEGSGSGPVNQWGDNADTGGDGNTGWGGNDTFGDGNDTFGNNNEASNANNNDIWNTGDTFGDNNGGSNANGTGWNHEGGANGNLGGDGNWNSNDGAGDTGGGNSGWGGADNTGGGAGSGDNTWGAPEANAGDTAGAWNMNNDRNNFNNDSGGNTGNMWDTNNNTGNTGNAWNAPASAKPATRPNSKAPTNNSASHSRSHRDSKHNSHSNTTQTSTASPIEVEVKPDDTFSADDLRLIARILQQDCSMVWNRVSWRFRDKTGRMLHPDVFEKKITGGVEDIAPDYYYVHLDSPKLQFQETTNLFKKILTEFSDKAIFAGAKKTNIHNNIWILMNPKTSEITFTRGGKGVATCSAVKKLKDIDFVEPFSYLYQAWRTFNKDNAIDTEVRTQMGALSCFLFLSGGLLKQLPNYTSFAYLLASACKDIVSEKRKGDLSSSANSRGPQIVRDAIAKGGYFAVDFVLRPLEKPKFGPRKDAIKSMIRPVRIQASIKATEPAKTKSAGGIKKPKSSPAKPKITPKAVKTTEFQDDNTKYTELEKKLAALENENELLQAEKADANARVEDANSKVTALQTITKEQSDRPRLEQQIKNRQRQEAEDLHRLKDAHEKTQEKLLEAQKKVDDAERLAAKVNGKLEKYKRMLENDSD
ncbi:Nn.00g117250.m01.CDS01 [Neocucurbitaria sp. VM-36]